MDDYSNSGGFGGFSTPWMGNWSGVGMGGPWGGGQQGGGAQPFGSGMPQMPWSNPQQGAPMDLNRFLQPQAYQSMWNAQPFGQMGGQQLAPQTYPSGPSPMDGSLPPGLAQAQALGGAFAPIGQALQGALSPLSGLFGLLGMGGQQQRSPTQMGGQSASGGGFGGFGGLFGGGR